MAMIAVTIENAGRASGPFPTYLSTAHQPPWCSERIGRHLFFSREN